MLLLENHEYKNLPPDVTISLRNKSRSPKSVPKVGKYEVYFPISYKMPDVCVNTILYETDKCLD